MKRLQIKLNNSEMSILKIVEGKRTSDDRNRISFCILPSIQFSPLILLPFIHGLLGRMMYVIRIINNSVYYVTILTKMADISFTGSHKAEKSDKFLDKFGTIRSIKQIIALRVIEVNFLFSIFQDVDINIAKCNKIFRGESSEVY
jgi:hypothetical protein